MGGEVIAAAGIEGSVAREVIAAAEIDLSVGGEVIAAAEIDGSAAARAIAAAEIDPSVGGEVIAAAGIDLSVGGEWSRLRRGARPRDGRQWQGWARGAGPLVERPEPRSGPYHQSRIPLAVPRV